MNPSVFLRYTAALGLILTTGPLAAQQISFEQASGYLPGGPLTGSATRGGVAAGDLDNDGDLDLIVFKSSGVVVLENTSSGGALSFVDRSSGFKKRTNNGNTFPNGQVVLADYDNDGDLDVFGVSDIYDQGMLWENHLLKGPSSSTTPEAFSFTYVGNGRGLTDAIFAGKYQRGVAVLDIDADGDLDVVFDTDVATTDGKLVFTNSLIQNGNPSFSLKTPSTVGNIEDSFSEQVSSLDYDLDGDTDLSFRSSYNGALNARKDVLFQNRTTSTSALSMVDVTASITPTVSNNNASLSGGMAWADYNLDGNLDLFAQNGTGSPSVEDVVLRVTRISGTETFSDVNTVGTLGAVMSTSGSESGGIALEDFDNDGDVDFFYGSRGGKILQSRQSQGGGALYTDRTSEFTWLADQFTNFVLYDGLVAADFDMDGDLDLYANEASSSNADVFIKNTLDQTNATYAQRFLRVRATCNGRDCIGATVSIYSAGLKEFDDSRASGDPNLPAIGYGTPYAYYTGYPGNTSHGSLSTNVFPGTYRGLQSIHGGMTTTGQRFITHFGGLLPDGRYTVRVLFPGGKVVLRDVVPEDAADTFNGRALTHFIEVDSADLSDDGDGIPAAEETTLGTSNQDLDSDDDGISDWREIETLDTNPAKKDTDGDGVPDGIELGWLASYVVPDPDGAGPLLGTGASFAADADPTTTTNPLDSDTDGDGLCDGVPTVNPGGCSGGEDSNNNGQFAGSDYANPLDLDTDDDAVGDAQEYSVGSNPKLTDTDGDGIADGVELGKTAGIAAPGGGIGGTSGSPALDRDPTTTTSPTSSDSDADGLTDGIEDADKDGGVDLTETNPSDSDTDDDLLLDGTEDRDKDGQRDVNETDPLDPDSDNDGVKDGTEDKDKDGVKDANETNPLDPDTDDDLLCDGSASLPPTCYTGEDLDNDGTQDSGETNPLDVDSDDDSLRDGDETLTQATNPLSKDTDGDGLCDGIITSGSNPGCIVGEAGTGAGVTGTSPTDPDSDDDRLCDGPKTVSGTCVAGETGLYGTNPKLKDTDSDKLEDYVEVIGEALDPGQASDTIFVNNTDPLVPDTDGDCILDGDEDKSRDGIFQGGVGGELNPNAMDTDNDDLPDGSTSSSVAAEGPCSGLAYPTVNHLSDPTNPDTDADGLGDGSEVNGTSSQGEVYQTLPRDPDTDNDGLCDGPNSVPSDGCIGGEIGGYDTNPLERDTDGDGLNDGAEVTHPTEATSPTNPDTDGDGLGDRTEVNASCATDANNSDSDDDGLCDGPAPDPQAAGCSLGTGLGEDRNANCLIESAGETSPLDGDSDDDGLCDGAIGLGAECIAGEIGFGAGYAGGDTNPLAPDSDSDGLCDGPATVGTICVGGEVGEVGSDPLDPDTDGDALCDGDATVIGQCQPGEVGGGVGYDGSDTDPLEADTDGDGLCDGPGSVAGICQSGEHGDVGTDPLNPDTDGGCELDGQEVIGGTNPIDDPTDDECNDLDGDGLSNAQEDILHSDPEDADSDDDGVMDGNERCLTEDTTEDGDLDGLPCWLDPDSDNDGLPDGVEIGLTAPQPLALGDTYIDYRDSTDLSYCPQNDDGTLAAVELQVLRGCSFWPDQDPDSTTDPLLADTDDGGADDGAEDPDKDGQADPTDLHPNDPDDDPAPVTSPLGCELGTFVQDLDCDGLTDLEEELYNLYTLRVDPNDADTDDDGVVDGDEANWNLDTDRDLLINVRDPDSDDDGVADGIEVGVTEASASADTDLDAGFFVSDGGYGDQDATTVTSMLSRDSDFDGADDGAEDPDHDGLVDAGERDPSSDLGEDPVPPPPADADDCYAGDPLLQDLDCDGLTDLEEQIFLVPLVPPTSRDPRQDADTDDDGLMDSEENNWSLAMVPGGLICAWNGDCDGDGVLDGTERGVTGRLADTAAQSPNYQADADSAESTTCMVDIDTDGGSIPDGTEDRNRDGKVDASETDPTNPTDDCVDLDLDGVCDEVEDNCVCDPEVDEDCSLFYNPDQTDGDRDGAGDVCDVCPEDAEDDVDADELCPSDDNCPLDYNPDQRDTDGDSVGDVCDPDCDGNGISNTQEEDLGLEVCDADSDGDGISDAWEVGDPDCFDMGDPPAGTSITKDGICNSFDSDDDGNPDAVELDSDADTLPDSLEAGIEPGSDERPQDTDEDGTPDYRDRDSDNDDILDLTESGSEQEDTLNYNPRDTDGDRIPDFLDTDSDNDALSDKCEQKGVAESCNDEPGEGTGTDPYEADYDGGGVNDGDEFFAGTNPRDPIDDGIFLTGGGGCDTGRGRAPTPWAGALLGLGLLLGRARRRSAGRVAALLGVLMLLAAPNGASAQTETTDRMNAQTYRPNLDGGSYITIWDTDSLRRWHFTVGISTNYALKPLQFQRATTVGGNTSYEYAENLGPVDHLVTTDIYGAVGLTDFLTVAASIPVTLYEDMYVPYSAADPTQDGYTRRTGQGLGDAWLAVKSQLLDPSEKLIGVALIPELSIPLVFGEDGYFLSEEQTTFRLRSAAEMRIPRLHLGANAALRIRPKQFDYRTITYRHAFEYGLGARVPLLEGLSVLTEFYGALGMQTNEEVSNRVTNPAEFLVGGQYNFGWGLILNAGTGYGVTDGLGSPRFRGFLTATYRTPLQLDTDGDGILDRLDQCPTDPENFNGVLDEDGCPEPDSDNDRLVDPVDACPMAPEDFDGYQDEDGCPDLDNDADGIPDDRDQCPIEAEDRDGFEDTDGCPDIDNDGDSLLDAADQCPNRAEDFDGYKDEDGCPDEDNDGDGVPDANDRCPNDKEDVDGFDDTDGCPDLDNDGDGIPDDRDRCPNEAEVINDVDDDDGCPDEGNQLVLIKEDRLVILFPIHFETAKTTIRADSMTLLRQIATTLKMNPYIKKIRIEGHTDNVGDDAYNLKLSQGRADSVRAALIENGVDPTRLEAIGYGETRPIDTNATVAGREHNRRVDFFIVEREDRFELRKKNPTTPAPTQPAPTGTSPTGAAPADKPTTPPAPAPVEKPADKPATSPAATPVEKPADKPATTAPVPAPADKPADKPATTAPAPVEKPADKPATTAPAPATAPADKPADKPATTAPAPVDKPADKPATTAPAPSTAPADQPADKPATTAPAPVEKPADKPTATPEPTPEPLF